MRFGQSSIGLTLLVSVFLGMGCAFVGQEGAIAALPYQAKHERMNQIGEAVTKGQQLLQNSDEGSLKAAIIQFENALRYNQGVQDKETQMFNAATLRTIGKIHLKLNDQKSAFVAFSRALTIFHDLQAYSYEAEMLNNIGYIYKAWGEHQKALESFEKSFQRYQVINHIRGMVIALNNLGHVYDELGNVKKTIELLDRALKISKLVNDPAIMSAILNNLGHGYFMLGDYKGALDLYNQSLILRPTKAYDDIATTLNNMGYVYQEQKKWNEALKFFDQSLMFYGRANNSLGQATALNSLGLSYERLGQVDKALVFYNKALSLWKDSPPGRAKVLNNIAISLVARGDINTAIAFYKLSINSFEWLRQSINQLPRSEQEIYTQTIRFSYTNLATLLVEQNRLSEARYVIELLKLRELKELSSTTPNRLTPNQSMPISEREKQSIAQINQEVVSDIKPEALPSTDRLSTHPLNQTAQNLLNAQPNSALIYHLITADKLWILLATQDGQLQKFAVNIQQKEIESLVKEFRNQIQQCERQSCDKADTQKLNIISQKLYQRLFPQDFQIALQKANAQHLTFALDGSLRNISIAALHTGQQYLIEQYSLSQIIAAQLTDSQDKLPTQPSILALGLSNRAEIPVPTFIDDRGKDLFDPLANVPIELEAIANRDPLLNSSNPPLLNDQFTLTTLQQNLPRHNILHIATHGIFRPNHLNYSYIVLGNGQPWSIAQIDQTQQLFRNIHLVTLSACQTGLGDKDSTGMEIAGMSHAFLSQGAKAVQASLWKIDDASTAMLMQRFYHHLSQSPQQTKAQALQQAQLHLLRTPPTQLEQELAASLSPETKRSPRFINLNTPSSQPQPHKIKDPTHPYYWASFILIGNSR